MDATVQIMALPPAVADTRPLIMLDDAGIWREAITIPGDVVSTKKKQIERHLKNAMNAVDSGNPISFQSVAFQSPFQVLYEYIVPSEVREALQRAKQEAAGERPLLKIYVNPIAEWIPWELLHDGTDYLGLQFLIARLPIVKQPTEVRGSLVRKVNSVCSLLGKDVFDDAVRADWGTTFDAIKPAANPVWELRYPPANSQNGDGYPTLDQIERNADIIHVTCHGGMHDDDDGQYWTLNHTEPFYTNYRITESFAKTLGLRSRPLIFGNACASAASDKTTLSLHGFGAEFMLGGALNFIGTLAPITKKTAVTLSQNFYRTLLDPANRPTIAEALWKAKTDSKSVEDPSFLFYCLYGPPSTTYEVV